MYFNDIENKALENDNTLQPLDQWTNSPFMGQQVWNCKSFTLTHYLADLFTMAQGQSHSASNIISNSHPFQSKWVDPPIPEIQQFQYLTLKIQGQGHWWGQSSKSQHGSNILSIQILFFPMSIRPPIPMTQNFSKFHLENPRSRS